MAWETVPPPNYAAFDNSALVGNALGNLVSNYQQAQQGQQRTQANDLRNQQDKMLLDQSKAFAGGVPMKNGMPDWPKIAAVQAEKGNVNALAALAPYIQHQQDIEGANAPDQFFPGGVRLNRRHAASNIASRIETKGQSDPYDALGQITKSGASTLTENTKSWGQQPRRGRRKSSALR